MKFDSMKKISKSKALWNNLKEIISHRIQSNRYYFTIIMIFLGHKFLSFLFHNIKKFCKLGQFFSTKEENENGLVSDKNADCQFTIHYMIFAISFEEKI